MLTRKSKEFFVLVFLIAILAITSGVALSTVRSPRAMVDISTNPSPLGYTKSLVLFLVPMVCLGYWVLRQKRAPQERKAFLITMAGLIPLAFLLDVFLGMAFFRFDYPKATLELYLPGYEFGKGWSLCIPLEEFVFYGAGFVVILLSYVWASEVLFRDFKIDPDFRTPRVFRGWLASIGTWLGVGVALFGIAWMIRKVGPEADKPGFPGYFLFLLCGSLLPSMICSRIAFPFINWRALTVAYLFMVLISQYWEGTLGIPYQWWGYRSEQMMGIYFKPLCNLPLEAVIVWTAAVWTTVIIYETVLVALYAGKRWLKVLGTSEEELQQIENKLLLKAETDGLFGGKIAMGRDRRTSRTNSP